MKRVVLLVVGLCLGGGVIGPAWGVTERYGWDASQRIPAYGDGHAAMEPVTIEVPDDLWIVDLNVRVDIIHPEVSDLVITLTAPWGESLDLKDEWSPPFHPLHRSNMLGTVFDDEAGWYLLEQEAPYEGHFWCDQGLKLSVFDGYNAKGVWTLDIYDAIYKDWGYLEYWELEITAEHSPEVGGCLYISLGVMAIRLGRRR